MREETWKELKVLLRLAREQGLGELTVGRPDFKLIVKRGRAGPPAAPAPGRKRPATPSPESGARRRSEARPARPLAWPICSPLTGIFYRSSSPEARAFVELGDLVEEGQTVCLVEAMKVFNEIPSERRGWVREILAASGDLVEDGQVLMVLEPE